MPSRSRGVALNASLIVAAQSTQAIAVGAIALFLPLIRADLGISFAEAGTLAAVSTLTYALMQIPAGLIADRVSAKLLFAVGVLGANVLAIVFAVSDSFAVMVASQAAAGVFRSLMFIPGMVLITRHFSEKRRATALGLFVAGGFSSNILISLLGPILVEPLGWAGVIVGASVLGLVVLAAYWWLGDEGAERDERQTASARWVWRTPAWWLLGLVQFARLTIVIGLTSWLPAFLIEERGVSLAATGGLSAIAAAIVAISNIGGGMLSDRLGRPLLVIGGSLATMTVLLAAVALADDLVVILILLAAISVFMQLYFGPLFAVPRRLFGPGVAGLSSGFGNFCANIGGFLSVLAVGLIKDATGSFDAGFGYLAVVALLGAAAVAVLGRVERDPRMRGTSRPTG
jgi:nitrate/nitrite transporter NarK